MSNVEECCPGVFGLAVLAGRVVAGFGMSISGTDGLESGAKTSPSGSDGLGSSFGAAGGGITTGGRKGSDSAKSNGRPLGAASGALAGGGAGFFFGYGWWHDRRRGGRIGLPELEWRPGRRRGGRRLDRNRWQLFRSGGWCDRRGGIRIAEIERRTGRRGFDGRLGGGHLLLRGGRRRGRSRGGGLRVTEVERRTRRGDRCGRLDRRGRLLFRGGRRYDRRRGGLGRIDQSRTANLTTGPRPAASFSRPAAGRPRAGGAGSSCPKSNGEPLA